MVCPLLNSTEFYRMICGALYLSYSSNTHERVPLFRLPPNFDPSGQTGPKAVIIQNFLETFTYEALIATLKVCVSGFVVSGSSEIHLNSIRKTMRKRGKKRSKFECGLGRTEIGSSSANELTNADRLVKGYWNSCWWLITPKRWGSLIQSRLKKRKERRNDHS